MATSRDPFLTPDAATPGLPTPTGSDSRQNLGGGGGDGSNPYSWQEKYTEPSTRRRKWIVFGSALVVVILIAIGVGVGVAVSHNHNHNSSNRAASSSNGNSPATNSSVVPQTNPNDPSTFVKDSRLHQSFWGFAYTPEGSVLPNCTAALPNVIQDIQLLSQLTTRLRLYGSDCNVSALVMEAIKQTKVNMTVWLGNYVNSDDAGAAYTRQRDLIESVITTYGTDHISGITVGNEFILNYLTENGATDPNSAVGNQGAQLLLMNVSDTATRIKAMNLPKHIPVGTSDAGAYFNTLVLEGVEYGMANVHPWFGNVSITDAADWTYTFFETTDVSAAAAVTNKPNMYIAETGWPTASDDAGDMTNGASAASVPNLQQFLNTYVCQANQNNTGYFYFEGFDETWKSVYGGVEPHWGIFNADKTLKNVTIPNCPSP
ncbi:glycoside hydrolase superfamily [Russula dissimulans]|nr:glycoside hydrolase superfamily [Russula dissimulans]